MRNVLTIAGSDSCGGAGIQADIKTMAALGTHGMSVITAITAQNSIGVFAAQEIIPEIIAAQIDAIYKDILVSAVKIGMLSSSIVMEVVSNKLQEYNAKNIVVDPVMISKSGYSLLKDEDVNSLRDFIKIAYLVTPNIPEAEVISGVKIENIDDMKLSANIIKNLGVKNILIKGGHMQGDCVDFILLENGNYFTLTSPRILTKNTHGTGCTLSSAIATFLAKEMSLLDAIKNAKLYITKAIENSFSVGSGVGPVGHFAELYQKAGVCYD